MRRFTAGLTLLGALHMGCGGSSAGAMAPNDAVVRGEHAARGGREDEAPAPQSPTSASGSMVAADVDKRVASNEPGAPPPPPPPKAPGSQGTKNEQATTVEMPVHDASMIVYTAILTLAVYQVQPNLVIVERIAKEQGGYLSVRGDNQIIIRVPRARFESALGAIEKIGDVLHRDIKAEDVTDQYVDLEIRIKNARAMQARLKQLLEKAAVKEALDIERELARVTQDLELMEGKLKLLRDKIAYSTITVVFEGRGSAVSGASKVKLPFPWLTQLGLPNLLQLREERVP